MNRQIRFGPDKQSVHDLQRPFEDRPILLLFSDDSTLFFCLRMRECLRRAAMNLDVHLCWVARENALSYRQLLQHLPAGPEVALSNAASFDALLTLRRYRAIITSRMYKGLATQLAKPATAAGAERPCVISFLGGLEFFPETAYYHRRFSDAVYLFPKSAVPTYQSNAANWEAPKWQRIGFGHPTCIMPAKPDQAVLADRKDIFFFPQALSPSTRRGRLHMLRCMAAIAQAHPASTVWIKLRHLPDENRNHLHREKYDYPNLLRSLDHVPPNLKVTACTMDEALAKAGLGITCTSTAAIDLLRDGVPSMVHLDFVDNYLDPLVAPMRRLFQDSGLIASLEDVLHLRAQAPKQAWVQQMFCPPDLGERILDDIAHFARRPFQVGRLL